MSGLRRQIARSIALALGVGLALCSCAKQDAGTGVQVEVSNGEGVPVPSYLLFDWKDSASVLVRDRRVPASGSLDPRAGQPLAVVRIAADAGGDPQRHITIRGMIGEDTVSQGEGTAQIVAGSWQTITVVLRATAGELPDGGAPPDGADLDASDDVVPTDAAEDVAPLDVAPDQAPVEAPPPPPDTSIDLPPDLRPDVPRDLPPDLPSGPVTIPAAADSFVEQGQTSAGMNFGKQTTLEVKTQAGADNNRVAYLRFSLTPIAGTPALSATLRVFGKSSGGTNMDSAYAITDETWTETAITWNNKPVLGMKLATASVGTTNQYREWNVTAFVRMQQAMGRDNVNFAIGMDGDTASSPDVFNSREATSNQPQLLITR